MSAGETARALAPRQVWRERRTGRMVVVVIVAGELVLLTRRVQPLWLASSIMPAATVAWVASSTKMKLPVARLRRYSS